MSSSYSNTVNHVQVTHLKISHREIWKRRNKTDRGTKTSNGQQEGLCLAAYVNIKNKSLQTLRSKSNFLLNLLRRRGGTLQEQHMKNWCTARGYLN